VAFIKDKYCTVREQHLKVKNILRCISKFKLTKLRSLEETELRTYVLGSMPIEAHLDTTGRFLFLADFSSHTQLLITFGCTLRHGQREEDLQYYIGISQTVSITVKALARGSKLFGYCPKGFQEYFRASGGPPRNPSRLSAGLSLNWAFLYITR
jgi:hypothetical protein